MSKRCSLGAHAAKEGIEARVRILRSHVEAVRRQEVAGIHDMRVASRRLRGALKECAPVLPGRARKDFEARIRGVTRSLGRPRELDVCIGLLESFRDKAVGRERSAATYALRRLRAQRNAAAAHCEEAVWAVDSASFQADFRALLGGIKAEQACFLERAVTRLGAQHKKLCTAYGRWKASRDEGDLHQLRIACKKFRYTCELYAPHYGEAMVELIGLLKQTQEALGAWNDYRVLRDEVSALAAGAPKESAHALPVLVRALNARGRACLDVFTVSAATFFSVSRRGALRQIVRTPTEACCRTRKKVGR